MNSPRLPASLDRAVDVARGADAGLDEDPLQLGQVGCGDGPVPVELLDGDVVPVLVQELPGLLAEPFEVIHWEQTGELDLGGLADRVGEVGVDDLPLALLDERHEHPKPATELFEHWEGDVGPPLVGLDLGDELQLPGDGRDRRVVLEKLGDALDLLS